MKTQRQLSNFIYKNLKSHEDYERGETYYSWKDKSYWDFSFPRMTGGVCEEMAKDIVEFLND
jgi:hypothetical protein